MINETNRESELVSMTRFEFKFIVEERYYVYLSVTQRIKRKYQMWSPKRHSKECFSQPGGNMLLLLKGIE